jgi:putative FmdB family regulatory protein
MPTYTFGCKLCNYEFEEFYQSSEPLPTACPKCGVDGSISRLIPGSTIGIVELTGHELKEKLRKEAKDYAKKAKKDERLYHNIVGGGKS